MINEIRKEIRLKIGANLNKVRMEKGQSKKKISLFLKVSQKTITSWEKGRTVPNANQIVKLSELYNVRVDYLIGLETKKRPN